MDPSGPQKKIKSNDYHVSFEKLVSGGGAKSSYGYNTKGGKTKHMSSGEAYEEDQGKVRGATKHTYKVRD